MLDLRGDRAVWPDDMKSWRDDPSDREPFTSWWDRVRGRLAGLHPLAAEQWIYRHFSYSPYFGVPLDGLATHEAVWPSQKILDEVYIGEPLDPVFTYKQLRDSHTGRIMVETGTWDFPLLIMHTPNGFRDWPGEHPELRYCLIEGHLRFRFLNALAHRGEAGQAHGVLILSYPALEPR